MKSDSKPKRQVFIELTPAGRLALKSLSERLKLSQSDAVDYAVKFVLKGGGPSPEDLGKLDAKMDRIIERL